MASFKQKYVDYITPCYICYILDLHLIKSLISVLIHSFDLLNLNTYLRSLRCGP